MFTIFDIEVFQFDWLIVYKEADTITRIHNDVEALKQRLSSIQILVGYNNNSYDDVVLAGILKGMDPYKLSKEIISGKKPRLSLPYLTLDVMQEAKLGLSLKEAQAYLGLNIHETPIDFNIDRPLTKEEIEQVFHYCENDVRVTEDLFNKREDYFTSKFEIVQTFKLPVSAVKKTKTGLSAAVLKARKKIPPRDRLHITYDNRLNLNELPPPIVDFYKDIESRYRAGESHEGLEKESLEISVGGIKHNYGFGGIHAARENYVHEGPMMQIDVGAYYATLALNNNFISRAAESPELFKDIYNERMRLKASEDPKQGTYKNVLTNKYGAMKSEYNPLFDPLQANNIAINGQLILTHLIILLKPFSKLIQSNTDGIIISYEECMKESIIDLLQRFEKQYEITFDVDLITKIAQRDVNNYCIKYENGKFKAKGRMANFQGGTWDRNSLHIIDKCLVDYYMHGIPVQTTIINCWKRNEMEWFQLVAKAGKFDGMAHEINGEMVNLQKVNRIFATNKKGFGSVYKTKIADGVTKYNKVPMAAENCLVCNEELTTFDKRVLDLNYYIKLVQGNLFV
jgi:hypothetical protein